MFSQFKYLEEIEGAPALRFATQESQQATQRLSKFPQYETLKKEIDVIFKSPHKLVWVDKVNDLAYNLWTDEHHQKGLFRRCNYQDYLNHQPQWQTVLDLDLLNSIEHQNWVWGGCSFLPSNPDKALIFLSPGGKDAVVVREFDMQSCTFVPEGFLIPEAKSSADWLDENTILVATDFGPHSLTTSGYPKIIKKIRRGQSLEEAELVFQGEDSDMSVSTSIDWVNKQINHILFIRLISFYETEVFLDNQKLPLPTSSVIETLWQENLFFSLREDLITSQKTFASGSVISLPLSKLTETNWHNYLELIFQPTNTTVFTSLVTTKSYLILEVLENIQGKLLKINRHNNSWETQELFNSRGDINVIDHEDDSDLIICATENFLTPPSIIQLDCDNKNIQIIQQAPEYFKTQDLTFSQNWCVSSDGVKIPYFLIHKKDLVFNGHNPTLIYGYGGFEESLTPEYLKVTGKAWLEKGGVYILANIRGGGEFGPSWHQSGLQENRPQVFEDFIAIAQDVINQKITSPKHLGIRGGSNGGLLVGAVMVKRPDLFNAVVCEVPLLDMLNYHTLLAGASWMDEYGDPADPELRPILLSYSPLHNLKPQTNYPEAFFLTSTKDDRVHPSHARKMVARLRELNHPVLYFENINGGHQGSSSLDESVLWETLVYTYLWEKLG